MVNHFDLRDFFTSFRDILLSPLRVKKKVITYVRKSDFFLMRQVIYQLRHSIKNNDIRLNLVLGWSSSVPGPTLVPSAVSQQRRSPYTVVCRPERGIRPPPFLLATPPFRRVNVCSDPGCVFSGVVIAEICSTGRILSLTIDLNNNR